MILTFFRGRLRS